MWRYGPCRHVVSASTVGRLPHSLARTGRSRRFISVGGRMSSRASDRRFSSRSSGCREPYRGSWRPHCLGGWGLWGPNRHLELVSLPNRCNDQHLLGHRSNGAPQVQRDRPRPLGQAALHRKRHAPWNDLLDTNPRSAQQVGQRHVCEDRDVRVVINVLGRTVAEVRLDEDDSPSRTQPPSHLLQGGRDLLPCQMPQ